MSYHLITLIIIIITLFKGSC